jgi:hypothetical protein
MIKKLLFRGFPKTSGCGKATLDFFLKKLRRFQIFGFWPAVLVGVVLTACFPDALRETPPEPEPAGTEFIPAAYRGAGTYAAALEELAETERSGGFEPGIGLPESMLREGLGDYGGAAIAAYKELSWAYGLGGGITREGIAEGLGAVLSLYEIREENPDLIDPSLGEEEREKALLAVRGLLAFHHGQWTKARLSLETLFDARDEPDSFAQWMCLVCRLEEGESSRQVFATYGAIRARYERFPEYWYRGARNFSGNLRGEYAEGCINLAPRGPFAEECRGILAETLGLSFEEKNNIRTLAEIETSVVRALSSDTPGVLTELFGLLSLHDNPYTLYAAGAMRALAVQEDFRTWFAREAAASSGRLAERLFYISRG